VGRAPLRIAVAQPLCVSYDVAVNAAIHAAMVRRAGARVVIFPELSLTGYELDAPAITVDDPLLAPILESCAEAGTLALVGAPVQGEAGRSHIAMLAVDSAGATVAYHKMWLGAAEADRFAPGSKPAVLDVDGWRLGLAICCKDTGTPLPGARRVRVRQPFAVRGGEQVGETPSHAGVRAGCTGDPQLEIPVVQRLGAGGVDGDAQLDAGRRHDGSRVAHRQGLDISVSEQDLDGAVQHRLLDERQQVGVAVGRKRV
jgi:hypothetical protein